ncbi:MAG: hypothetical protein J6J43_05945 [Oscillospiraceae bacterium]|nr:hypothetical protein [Oscillospiraceae bacterium]
MPSYLSFPRAAVYTPETLPNEPTAPVAILTRDRVHEPLLQQYALKFSDLLIVPEIWKEVIPQAAIMISSAICGGEIKERFISAAKERPCWLLVEKICHRFPLPCLDAIGQSCDMPPIDGFYAASLCCHYSHGAVPSGEMVLWDTEDTIQKKIQLAKDAGFHGFVLPSL